MSPIIASFKDQCLGIVESKFRNIKILTIVYLMEDKGHTPGPDCFKKWMHAVLMLDILFHLYVS